MASNRAQSGRAGRRATGCFGLPPLPQAGELARRGGPYRARLLRRPGLLGPRRPGFGDPRAPRSCWWAWPRPRTAPTAPAGCSRGTAPATGSSLPCTGRGTPRNPPARRGTTACTCAGPTSRQPCTARRRPTSRPRPSADACAPYLARAAPLARRRGPGGPGPGRLAGGGSPLRAAPPPGLRPPGRVPAPGRADAARLVPPQPAEHVHRKAHGSDVRRRLRPCPP